MSTFSRFIAALIRRLAVAAGIAFFVAIALNPSRAASPRGLPYSRFYSFDEIGDVSSGADLFFDNDGRLALAKDGVCMVLDDGTWLNRLEEKKSDVSVQHVFFDAQKNPYFGAVGTWGLLRWTEKGLLRPEPLKPESSPLWTFQTEFNAACRTENGVCFSGFNGIAYWLRRENRTIFHQIGGVVRVFSLGDEVYISSYEKGVQILDSVTGELKSAPKFSSLIVDQIAKLPENRAIVSTGNRKLMVYDGNRFTPIAGPWDDERISSVQALPEGNVALAVLGKGLYIIDRDGKIVSALVDTDYRRISALAASGPGVLWAETEAGIFKILYNSPITVFGQALGLPVRWPQLFAWQNQINVASGGRLYQSDSPKAGEPLHFLPASEALGGGVWALGVWKDWLLAGGSRGLFAKKAGGDFQRIPTQLSVGKIFVLDSGLCFVVDTDEISLLRCDGDQWREVAPRIRGAGFPAAGLTVKNAAWVEVGANVAVRLSFDGHKIIKRVIDSFPWRDPRWIHISAIGETVVLAGPESGRIFFDEAKEELEYHSPLEERLDRGPYWPTRIQVDSTGAWWISHQHGVYINYLKDNRPTIDNTTYRMISEHIPTIHILDGDQVWMSTSDSLYHLDRRDSVAPPLSLKPMLVSVRDLRTENELDRGKFARRTALPFSQNSLALRFFSGSYAVRQGLYYEASINQSEWSRLDGSMLTLSNLHEGDYRIAVRLGDAKGPIGESAEFKLAVLPPASRTWFALLGYAVAFAGGLYCLVHFLLYRSRKRSAALEQTVAERTKQLKQAMDKLEQEARTSATLAERNRLAGEIHDSLEQSFTALSLQLETTANFPHCPTEVGRGLSLARNMVAFSRDEIRHAIWDLHSPLLDKDGLEGALRWLMTQLTPDSILSSLEVEGNACRLSSAAEHHLLRIAQETIANAVKHANARRISVRLAYGPREIVLSVHDDGRGFDPAAILEARSGHFGLRSLRSRAAKMDGVLTIESSPGAGTTIVARVPLS